MELNVIEKIHLKALLDVEIEDLRKLLNYWLKEKNYFMIQSCLNDIFKDLNIIKKLDE